MPSRRPPTRLAACRLGAVYVWQLDAPAAPPLVLRGHSAEATGVDWSAARPSQVGSRSEPCLSRLGAHSSLGAPPTRPSSPPAPTTAPSASGAWRAAQRATRRRWARTCARRGEATQRRPAAGRATLLPRRARCPRNTRRPPRWAPPPPEAAPAPAPRRRSRAGQRRRRARAPRPRRHARRWRSALRRGPRPARASRACETTFVRGDRREFRLSSQRHEQSRH